MTTVKTEAAFTPGPWAVVPRDDEHTTLVSGNLLAPPGEPRNGGIYVARVTGPDNEANARLIAAAPELYEALETARDMLLERIHGNPARSAAHNARVIIEAAIRKARGDAPSSKGLMDG